MHSLIKLANYNLSGGADMMFQTETGISVIGASDVTSVPWSFTQLASRTYGIAMNFWAFSGDDIIAPYVSNLRGPATVDFVLTSRWGLGIGYQAAAGFTANAATAFGSIPLTDPEQLVGIGKFDRTDKTTLLYKKVSVVTPTKPAVLTYNNDQYRTGVQSKETSFTPNAITSLAS